MTELPLPAALQAWHPWLSWLAPELADVMGDVLRRMHPLFGRFQGRRLGASDEPDGVDHLHRKGSYERLLSSEWLLASEAPDEFLRRAASAEHLFLAPRPRAMKSDRLILAVFDAGPLQLGAPRLAHLAIWILLARRAAEAGGELRWGVLHKPGQWHGANDAEKLKQLLQARTFDVAGELQWTEWAQWLGEQGSDFGEVWLIGHEPEILQSRPFLPSHTVGLRPGLDGASLEIALRNGAALRGMALALPDPQPAARLLRGDFLSQAPVLPYETCDERLSLIMAPIISPDGLQLAVPLLGGNGAMVFRIPVSAERNRAQQRRQQWPQGAAPLAVMFTGKTLCAVLDEAQRLHFWQLTGFKTSSRPPKEHFDAPPGRGSLLPGIVLREKARLRLYVLDAANQLVWWVGPQKPSTLDQPQEARGPMVLDRQVLAIAYATQQRISYVVKDKGLLYLRSADATGRVNGMRHFANCHLSQTQLFLATATRRSLGLACCAVRVSGGDHPQAWHVHEGLEDQLAPEKYWKVQLDAGASAVGLVYQKHLKCHALVVLARNRSGFVLHSKHGSQAMLTLAAAVKRVSVCSSSGLVAILTADRTLHVYSSSSQSLSLLVRSSTQEAEGAV